jgi:hypothetical protein
MMFELGQPCEVLFRIQSTSNIFDNLASGLGGYSLVKHCSDSNVMRGEERLTP